MIYFELSEWTTTQALGRHVTARLHTVRLTEVYVSHCETMGL